MLRGMKCTIQHAAVCFHRRDLATPLVLPSGAITQLVEAEAQVTVAVDGRTAVGFGCVYLSDLWAWHDTPLAHADREQYMQRLCEAAADALPSVVDRPTHPLEVGLQLHRLWVDDTAFAADAVSARAAEQRTSTDDATPPALARAVCISPFDAALHDAVGRAIGRGALDLYEVDEPLPLADHYLDGNAAAKIRGLIDRPARNTLPAWWIVNRNDDLGATVVPAVTQHGYRCFKLKSTGVDVDADVRRTVYVYRSAVTAGARDVQVVIDSNEATPNADDVALLLREVERQDPEAFAAIAYMEQPTARDVARHPFDWRAIGAVRPVMLDEGLTSLDLLPLAHEQGWTGLALKTCKGHSAMLVAAAWGASRDMLLSMQDLTNPGHAAVHAAVAASRLPVINGVELNSLQFTPAANTAWHAALPDLFHVAQGVHQLPADAPIGLGSAWLDSAD